MTREPHAPVMADFVFGGIESDESRLLETERSRWHGLRHFQQIDPLDPKPGEAVTLTVTVGPDLYIDRLTAYLTTDGANPAGRRGVAEQGHAISLTCMKNRWEPLIWDFVSLWQGELPAQTDGTFVQYRIEGWSSVDDTVSHWSREQNLDRTIERPARYGYVVDTLTPPDWARDAVLYHVFVDRFTGVENRWLKPDELVHFAGGTLRGVIDRLDYIADLGVTTLWLSPFFKTTSYHGYDIADYYQVDSRFGVHDGVHTLVAAAHARGLRVILDFVANHVSLEFTPFVEARSDPTSDFRRWFSFDAAYRHGYRSFFDVAAMPQLNTDDPGVRAFLCDAAQYWLREFDVDGYRLDYAAGPGHAFWSEFRAACRAVKPDCWLFGEVTRAGEELRSYDGRLDGCLDFSFCRRVRQLCAGTRPSISLVEFVNTVIHSRNFFGENFLLPSFIENHDMNRFLYVAGNDQQRLKLAAGLMFALGGPPILYYGSEVGLSQPRAKEPYREESRHPMLWGDAQDSALLTWFKKWVALRRMHPAMSRGAVRTLALDEAAGIWDFARVTEGDEVHFRLDLQNRTLCPN